MVKTKRQKKGGKMAVTQAKARADRGQCIGKRRVLKGTKIHTADVAEQIANQHDLTKARSKGIVLDIFTIIAAILQQGGSFSLPGFGSFKRIKVRARTVKSPQTGQSINIPAHNKVRFVSSKGLKESVNNA